MRVREEKEKKKSETRASPLTGEMLVSGGKEGGRESSELPNVGEKRCYAAEGAN